MKMPSEQMYLVQQYQASEASQALRSTFHSPVYGYKMSTNEIACKAEAQIYTALLIGKIARMEAFRALMPNTEHGEDNMQDDDKQLTQKINTQEMDAAYTMLSLAY